MEKRLDTSNEAEWDDYTPQRAQHPIPGHDRPARSYGLYGEGSETSEGTGVEKETGEDEILELLRGMAPKVFD